MSVLKIRHLTSYRYRVPVQLNPHRLTLRPRESRTLRLISHDIAVSPAANITWAQDVNGNAIATAKFASTSDTLDIESVSTVRLEDAPWPVFDIAFSALRYPFEYDETDQLDLGALRSVGEFSGINRLRAWANEFVLENGTDTLSLLKDLNAGVYRATAYRSRESEGTQSPLQTLDIGAGSCRDFAVLFVEAARALGFGARIVSGYLNGLVPGTVGSSPTGSTHAWAEVFVPGAGWITFDPTNKSVGGFNLIPMATARDIAQIMPVSGSFVGPADALIEMTVDVSFEATTIGPNMQ